MKIIIPGGAGLVGQNLVVELKSQGFSSIVVIDKHRHNSEILARQHPDIHVICADLSISGDWESSFEGGNAVVMLQAQIGGNVQEAFTRNNLQSTERVLELVKRHGIPQVVHVSSSVVQSVADDFYTNSKKAQEKLVLASGVPAVVLRPTLMFGWFDRKHLGWLARFMEKVPVFPVPGDGRYTRQPLYAKDFCRVIVACLRQRIVSGVFDISGQEKVFYIDIIRMIKQATRARALILTIPYGLFHFLLKIWSAFDRNPPFTTQQLEALVACDEFVVNDWPARFGGGSTPVSIAINETFNHPEHSKVNLDF